MGFPIFSLPIWSQVVSDSVVELAGALCLEACAGVALRIMLHYSVGLSSRVLGLMRQYSHVRNGVRLG